VPRATTDEARAVAEELLGHTVEGVWPYKPAVGGDDSYSFRARAVGRSMLLKIKRRPGTPVGVYFHERIRRAGVPVPELLGFNATVGPEGQACALWEWVDGVPAAWGEGEPCPYDEAEFGRMLRTIHELRFDGPFGVLGDDPGMPWPGSHPDLGPVSDTWAGFFGCDRAARRYLDRGYLTAEEAERLAGLPERLAPELNAAKRRLLHMGDIMHQGNMILDPHTGRIRAVVDYVESAAGDPRWELAWVDYYFAQYPFAEPGFDVRRFRRAYETGYDPDDPVGRFYLLAILVFEKLRFFDPASERGRWGIRTVKELLTTFGFG
jgi:aminoglycoside phosphotransferase (APT) family kinase protein